MRIMLHDAQPVNLYAVKERDDESQQAVPPVGCLSAV